MQEYNFYLEKCCIYKMPRRKPNKTQEEILVNQKEELRNKLKQKLHEKKLERTSRAVRDSKMEELEEKLEDSRNPAEKHKLKQELDLLTKIQEKELDNLAGDYPDYGGGCDYGGSMERSD